MPFRSGKIIRPMQNLQFLRDWLEANPTTTAFLKYLIWVVLALLLTIFLRRWVRRRVLDTHKRYRSQKGVELIGVLIVVIVTTTYFSGNIKDFALAVGLFTAGITITLQELILSLAGSVFIYMINVYKLGDRIEINGIKGDVIDINSLYTTMMEIGQWVSSDNYSGRIVKLSNAFVFRGPVYNYSRDFPFIWDEFDLPVRHGSDLNEAKEIILKIASEELSDFVKQSHLRWQSVVQKYYIENAEVAPTLAVTLTDNWAQFNLRYIVDYRKRRSTRHRLQERIGLAIRETNGRVELASATLELVRVPLLSETKGKPKL